MGRNRKVIPAPIMTCVRCKVPLPMACFRETRPGFYDSSCKDCRREATRIYMREYTKKRNSTERIVRGEYDFVFNADIYYG